MADLNNRWCIVTTNGRRTLGLAASFAGAGIEAWSPRETRRRQLPVKARAARGAPQFKESEEPIMPGFVFVRAPHLPDLLRALAQPINPHPAFTIFQLSRGAPLIADGEIKALRDREERARRAIRKTKHYVVPVGMKVNPTAGPLAGLTGVVEEVDGRTASVVFNGSFRVKIDTWQLLDDPVKGSSVSGSRDGQQTNRLGLVAGGGDPAPFCVGRAA